MQLWNPAFQMDRSNHGHAFPRVEWREHRTPKGVPGFFRSRSINITLLPSEESVPAKHKKQACSSPQLCESLSRNLTALQLRHSQLR
jgi:hypothetical protein